MTHSVRLPDHTLASLDNQLPKDRVAVFKQHDLPEALAALAEVDLWELPELRQAPGIRRFTVEAARTVAGYHLLVGLDTWANEAGAIVVHVIDVWPDRWPKPD